MSSRTFTLAVLLRLAVAASIYVSPSGSNSGTGTITAPFLSIQSAVNAASPGDTIYLRGGTYKPTANIQITKSGTSSAVYTLRAYSGETPIIDGESLPYTPADVGGSLPEASRGILHVVGAQFWSFYDLELINGPYGVYMRNTNYTHWERIKTHDNYESGFQMQGYTHDNIILYLDSYRNRDPRKNGESADGFACKEGVGTGNVLSGARLWDNVDDGLDLWEFKSPVTILDTISWGNGFNRWGFSNFAGDGNGFKLGGGDAADKGPANHVVRNCIAFGNAAKGFTDNSQPGNFVIERNTAWANGDTGFEFDTDKCSLVKNIAAVNANSQADLEGQSQSGNSWNQAVTWSNSSFKSIDINLVKGSRQASGKITASNFLLPVSGEAIGATTSWS